MHHDTTPMPRINRRDGQPPGAPVAGETRLDLQELTARAIDAPTVAVTAIPPATVRAARDAVRERTERQPAVAAPTAAAPAVPGSGDPDVAAAAALVNRVLDNQARLDLAASKRLDVLTAVRRRGPRGVFGWRPTQGPNVHEVAEARRRVALEEERRKHAHVRRMDRLEAARAWLGLLILVALFLLVVGMGVVGFMIMHGDFAWAPTRVK